MPPISRPCSPSRPRNRCRRSTSSRPTSPTASPIIGGHAYEDHRELMRSEASPPVSGRAPCPASRRPISSRLSIATANLANTSRELAGSCGQRRRPRLLRRCRTRITAAGCSSPKSCATASAAIRNIIFAKRITGPNGDFIGVVLTGMKLSYFQHIYNSITSLRNQSFLLLRSDGTVLVRHPDPDDRAGEKMPANERLVSAGARRRRTISHARLFRRRAAAGRGAAAEGLSAGRQRRRHRSLGAREVELPRDADRARRGADAALLAGADLRAQQQIRAARRLAGIARRTRGASRRKVARTRTGQYSRRSRGQQHGPGPDHVQQQVRAGGLQPALSAALFVLAGHGETRHDVPANSRISGRHQDLLRRYRRMHRQT